MTANEIRNIRGDMTRKDFAIKIGYSPRTVEEWEQVNRRVSPSNRAIKIMRGK